MKASLFNTRLRDMTRRFGIHAYTTRTLFDCILGGESRRAREATLAQAVKDGVLMRYCRGVYVYQIDDCPHDIRQEAVLRLRPGHFSYISAASALVGWGVIDQQTMGAITVMTSGRSRHYRVPNGDILLTHTTRPYAAVSPDLLAPSDGDKLPTATPMLAYRDLRKTGCCVDLVDMDMLREIAATVERDRSV